MLITPETSDERIRFIDEHTDGFVYMVSSASTTGAQKSFDEAKQEYFQRINAMYEVNNNAFAFEYLSLNKEEFRFKFAHVMYTAFKKK